ncbi:MAG TPA: pyrimidine-nucleoside phosphorylase, partial [Vicinamibacteria bacterium]|nr:pyrimidine-nucleoside phosphorylase [Vicinamibacteria bacterium]
DNVGNALEVEEALSVLEGRGPADLVTLSLRLAAEMLVLGGVASSRAEAEKKVAEERSSGRGREKFLQIVEAQGGDPGFADRRLFDRASASVEVRATRDGFVNAMDAELIGTASMLLGAGRERREDSIDRQAGIVVHAKIGAELRNGERLVTLHFNDRSRVERAVQCIHSAYEIREAPPRETPRLVREVLEQETSA